MLLLLRGLSVAAQTDVTVTNEAEINTAFQEYSPAFYQDGLVFIASNPAVSTDKKEDDKTGKTTTSIFWAKKGEKSLLLKPVPFAKELTTKFYDGPLSFSTDANTIFFTRSNVKRNNPIRAKDGLVKLKIYSAQLKGDVWTNISELPLKLLWAGIPSDRKAGSDCFLLPANFPIRFRFHPVINRQPP